MLVKLYLLTKYIYIPGLLEADSNSLFGRLADDIMHWRSSTSTVRNLFDQILGILKNPRRYPREAVIIISSVILTFILILFLIAIAFSIKKQYQVYKASKRVKRAIPKEELVRRAIITGIILVTFLVVINVSASQPTLCARCHNIEKSHAEWQKSTHKDVGCLSCHYEPGVYGYIIGNITGTEHLLAHFFKGDELPSSVVSNDSCLQCHRDIFKKVVENDSEIRVRHEDLITGGFTCTSCHPAVAHKAVAGKTFAMDSCTGCHNGRTASSKCSICHQQDIAYKSIRTLDDWPKVKEIAIKCVGCHDDNTTQRCIDCHGLVLPHSAEFKKHHPMQAEALKGLCYKCHWGKMTENRMCGCHDSQGEIHGSPENWYFEHRTAAKNGGAGCNCHGVSFCGRCHDNPESVYPMNYAGGGGAYQKHGGWSTGMGFR